MHRMEFDGWEMALHGSSGGPRMSYRAALWQLVDNFEQMTYEEAA